MSTFLDEAETVIKETMLQAAALLENDAIELKIIYFKRGLWTSSEAKKEYEKRKKIASKLQKLIPLEEL